MQPFNVITIDPGREVQCDACGGDWTNRQESGGFYGHGTKAICPDCEPRWIESSRTLGELHLIKAYCPKDMYFADWVRDVLRTEKCPR